MEVNQKDFLQHFIRNRINIPVEKVDPWYANIVERKFRVIDSVESHLEPHIFNSDIGKDLKVVVTDWYHKPMDSMLDS